MRERVSSALGWAGRGSVGRVQSMPSSMPAGHSCPRRPGREAPSFHLCWLESCGCCGRPYTGWHTLGWWSWWAVEQWKLQCWLKRPERGGGSSNVKVGFTAFCALKKGPFTPIRKRKIRFLSLQRSSSAKWQHFSILITRNLHCFHREVWYFCI